MKNTSAFRGVKELYNELGMFLCAIKKTKGDSNKRMWEKFETQMGREEDEDDGL